jgi:hypothetical protein
MDMETVKEICVADLGIPLLDTSVPAPIAIMPDVSSFTSDIYGDDAYFVMNDLMHKEVVSAVVQLKSIEMPAEEAGRLFSLWRVRLTTGMTIFIQVSENGFHRTLQKAAKFHQKLLIYAVEDEGFAAFVQDYAMAAYLLHARTIMSILVEMVGTGMRSITADLPANQAEYWRRALTEDVSKAMDSAPALLQA